MEGVGEYYDVVVIGSGLGGLTGANYLAKHGHSVLLLEHHYQFGLANGLKEQADIFLIYPYGSRNTKSCKRY